MEPLFDFGKAPREKKLVDFFLRGADFWKNKVVLEDAKARLGAEERASIVQNLHRFQKVCMFFLATFR